MKKIIITLAVVICCLQGHSQFADTVTISGYVTNLTGAPVPNHYVSIHSDTSSTQFSYWNTVYTNSNGYYMDTIMIPLPYAGTAITFGVYTSDCNQNYLSAQVSTLNQPMTANFTICDSIPTSLCNANFYHYSDTTNYYNIAFYDNSTGNITSWYWYFGDNTTSTLQNPVHNYANNGLYSICLTVKEEDSNGNILCSNTFCDSITIGALPSNCQANFAWSFDSINNNMHFYDYSYGSNITSWYWNFGDNDTSMSQNPVHHYTNNGYYIVCLTVYEEDSNGNIICTNTHCDTINVGMPPITTNCQANFAWSVDSVGNNVYFSDYSTGNITSWSWDFGDGSTSALQNPVHNYTNNGTYYVCLTITSDSMGTTCTNTHCDNIAIYNNPYNPCNSLFVNVASIINESSAGAADGAININVVGGTVPYTFIWSNGAISQNISGLSAGFYYLTVTDSMNCQSFAAFDVLDASDSTNWNYNDTLITNVVDTCFNFIPASASIYSFSYPNSNTISVTWIVFDASGLSHGFVTVDYSIDSSGYYTAPLSIECDTVKTIYNFYDNLHIVNSLSGINSSDFSEANITLFPNPVTDNLNIYLDTPKSDGFIVNILNSLGQVIITKNILAESANKTVIINTTSLPQGLYFVHINYKEQNLMRKFIK